MPNKPVKQHVKFDMLKYEWMV